jgi:hypothetical protein
MVFVCAYLVDGNPQNKTKHKLAIYDPKVVNDILPVAIFKKFDMNIRFHVRLLGTQKNLQIQFGIAMNSL